MYSTTDLTNSLLNYKKIFSHNRKKDNSIVYMKKTEYDIFYSNRYKYPILVKENITSQTGNPDVNEARINRSKIEDPFMEDLEIPTQYRHTLEDYKKYMPYGVSMGHNAPAGQHKTNMKVFSETFLLSNITPQEMVLNSGLWALMENWCKKLSENKSLYDITIFTGSIPSKTNANINININSNSKNIDNVIMNIPEKMFKIICFHHIDNPNITYMEILIVKNSPYYINPKILNYDLSSYLIPVKSWNWFQSYSGIDINNLLEFYNFNTNKIKPFRNIISMSIHLHRLLQLLMKKSNWYGYLIYATSIEELDKKWEECKLQSFEDLKYHREFYELVRQKILNNDNYTIFEKSYKTSSKISNLNSKNSKSSKTYKTFNKYKKYNKFNSKNKFISKTKKKFISK